ncbi:hypothetical protein N182_34235 [Sinorhizobium sp. GL2]|nr:hypothetical protein N182_34235 [Sinorhizobium sp. GL2]
MLEKAAAMGAATGGNLFRYIGKVEHGALHARAYYEGAAPLDTQQYAIRLQFAQGPAYGKARRAKLAGKIHFRGDLKVGRPFFGFDTAIDYALDLLVKGLV